MKSRIEREAGTLGLMVARYCRIRHGGVEPCEACAALAAYARARLAACRYGESKPSCRACPTHCYRPDRREEIRALMRFIGPRMILFGPLALLDHALRRRRG